MEEDHLFKPAPWSNTDEIMNVDGSKFMKTTYTDGTAMTTLLPPTFHDYPEYERAFRVALERDGEVIPRKFFDEGDIDVKVYKERRPYGNEYAVTCDNPRDLSTEYILKNLSKIKGKLMMVCAPVHVNHFECRMTPEVKNNIVMAYKKLNMYGKEPPIIARFDDYGNRLPDKINIDTIRGMDLKIVDPEDYGPCYLEIKALVESCEPERYITEEDLPF